MAQTPNLMPTASRALGNSAASPHLIPSSSPSWRTLLSLGCLAFSLSCASSAALATESSNGNAAEAEDSGVLVINGCPIWPYTRCPGADLRHADLAGKNLAGADLRGADLTRADLRNTNLAAANLEGANLTAARMQKISAASSNFTNAKLIGADMEAGRKES